MPKLTLVSRLQALLHEARLKIQRELAEAETLVRELQDFRVDYTAAGHLTFNARTGKHDDLVLALAIAVWRAHGGGMANYGLYELMRQQALGSAASVPRYYVGVDLGQSRDPTAIAVVRRVDPPRPVPEKEKPKPDYASRSSDVETTTLRRDDQTHSTGAGQTAARHLGNCMRSTEPG